MFGDTDGERRRREEEARRRDEERRKRLSEERREKKQRIKEQQRREKRAKELERRREVSKKFIEKMQNNILGDVTPEYMQPQEIKKPEIQKLCRAGFGFSVQNPATKRELQKPSGPAGMVDHVGQQGQPSSAAPTGAAPCVRLKRPI